MKRIAIYSVYVIALVALGVSQSAYAQGVPELMDDTPGIERPWPQDPQKFDFMIVGDKWSGGEGQWPIFDMAIKEINLLRPDFAIMVGDMIPGHMVVKDEWDRQWTEFRSHADRIDVPFLLLPGNHDISSPEMYGFWREDFGRTYYSFNYMGCHFITINTEEDRFDGRGEIWTRMIEFIEADLAANQSARHTFLFMHKPMWRDQRYSDAWESITKALGERRYSAFAGHWHTLEYDDTLPGRHMVVAATGGGLSPSPLKELGRFHHYTKVTVEGDSVYIALIEPGGEMHGEKIAQRTHSEKVERMVHVQGRMPENLHDARATVTVDVIMTNPLDSVAQLDILLSGVDESGWEFVSGEFDSIRVVMAPGVREVRTLKFSVPHEHLMSRPTLHWRGLRDGEPFVGGRGTALPVFPDSVQRPIPEWDVVGPFALGEVNTEYLPGSPRLGIPGLFDVERVNVLSPDSLYEDGGRELKLVRSKATSSGLLNFNGIVGTEDHALGYAFSSIYSPTDRTVYVGLRADNFVQVLLNGSLVEHAQRFGGTGRPFNARLELRAGWNAVAVKLINNRGDWWLRTVVADPAGDLQFAPGVRQGLE
jgi:hypothetical protein